MEKYYISGVWKNSSGLITHYLVHEIDDQGEVVVTKKMTKTTVINKLDLGHKAVTVVWNYVKVSWMEGEDVEVVNGQNGSYLRTLPDSRRTDNLAHLVDYGEIKL